MGLFSRIKKMFSSGEEDKEIDEELELEEESEVEEVEEEPENEEVEEGNGYSIRTWWRPGSNKTRWKV